MSPSSPPPHAASPSGRSRRNPWLVALLVVAIVLALSGLAFVALMLIAISQFGSNK
jgi:uncharacterized membrane protein YhaH (DUF805 family)